MIIRDENLVYVQFKDLLFLEEINFTLTKDMKVALEIYKENIELFKDTEFDMFRDNETINFFNHGRKAVEYNNFKDEHVSSLEYGIISCINYLNSDITEIERKVVSHFLEDLYAIYRHKTYKERLQLPDKVYRGNLDAYELTYNGNTFYVTEGYNHDIIYITREDGEELSQDDLIKDNDGTMLLYILSNKLIEKKIKEGILFVPKEGFIRPDFTCKLSSDRTVLKLYFDFKKNAGRVYQKVRDNNENI